MSYYSGKTVLVTGATGLIGSHIVNELMAMGDVEVIALSRSERKLKQTFSEHLDNPRLKHIAQDVVDSLNLDDNYIDVIFHAASPMSEKTIKNYPVDVISPNMFGTLNCLELLRRQKISFGRSGRIVLFSSVTVYGNLSDKDLLVSESDTVVASSLDNDSAPYSESKRMIEVIARAYIKQFEINAVIARLSTVYGTVVCQPETAFFSFMDKVIANEEIVINSSGIARRDNIYINDAVSGLMTICEKGAIGEAYNVSSNAELEGFKAVDEIAEMMSEAARELFGYTAKVTYGAGKSEIRSPGKILDNTKLKSLGWTLTTSHNDGIRRILEERIKR